MTFHLGLSYCTDSEIDSELGRKLAADIKGLGGSIVDVDCNEAVGRFTSFDDIRREYDIGHLAIIWSRACESRRRFHTLARVASQSNALWLIRIDESPLPVLPPITAPANPPTFDVGLTAKLEDQAGFAKLLSEYSKNAPVKRPNPLSSEKTEDGYRRLKKGQRVSVFVSHAGADKAHISPILSVFIRCGFELWVDKPRDLNMAEEEKSIIKRLTTGESWDRQIESALEKMDVVLGMWSCNADDDTKEIYHRELFTALRMDKLYICCLDEHRLRAPYRMIQFAKLSSFQIGVTSRELSDLIEDISNRLRFNTTISPRPLSLDGG